MSLATRMNPSKSTAPTSKQSLRSSPSTTSFCITNTASLKAPDRENELSSHLLSRQAHKTRIVPKNPSRPLLPRIDSVKLCHYSHVVGGGAVDLSGRNPTAEPVVPREIPARGPYPSAAAKSVDLVGNLACSLGGGVIASGRTSVGYADHEGFGEGDECSPLS